MASSPVVKIGFTFRDRDHNAAKMTIYSRFVVPIADVWTMALAMASAAGALSDATLEAIELIYRWTIDDPGLPADSSSIERKILMLMINADDEINGIIIPSPGDVWESTGSYAGIRLDLLGAPALGWVAMLGDVDFRTKDGHLLGTVLAAGGLAY